MKAKADRIGRLSEACAALLEKEQQAYRETVSHIIESIRVLQGDTADRRLQRLFGQVKDLQQRLDLLVGMARLDYLAKIGREADDLAGANVDGRAGQVIIALLQSSSSSSSLFCEAVLDQLIRVTGAERGFILFYIPESTEADVIAARNFQTRNLSLEEYNFSRTMLAEVFRTGKSLLLEDAMSDPAYSNETSVIKFQLKSIVAAPLKVNERTVGALYLENNIRPSLFDADVPRLLENVGCFALSYLRHARLMPFAFESDSRTFFDVGKASKEIAGRDPKILAVLEVINRIADSPATVLIEGESGTGKELIARALHFESFRRDRPFVAINCAAIPETLLESELFGYERGAFTGATERRIGRIEQGKGGTVFLDEVSELAYPLQAKLLRFLQSNEFSRLGGKEVVKVDARIVAATSKDLKAMMKEGRFQEALYYRLNVIPVRVPALRERKEDIPLLIDLFLDRLSSIYGRRVRADRDVYECMKQYGFPGNVRELENMVHCLVALAEGDTIHASALPPEVLETRAQRVSLEKDPIYHALYTTPEDLGELKRRKKEMRRLLAEQERLFAERAVEQTNGNLTEAASRLGIHRITLHRMLRR
ncbi:MAG: sigma 54-interacting transcriptional regulator [Blastocatellia bacterium]